jgi:hypothetical protein
MLTIIETSIFIQYANTVWDEDERIAFVNWIAANPLAGDVVPKSGGCRKVRWSRAGMGKRGGVRVIYFNQLAAGEIILLMVYAKAKYDNLPAEFFKQLKEVFDG